MAEKNNNERDVLQAILDALDQVSEDGRERILRTVSTFYDIDLSNGPRLFSSDPRPTIHKVANDRDLSFADRETISPKDFLQEKHPGTDVERVICLAYYLTHYRDTPHFKTIDISNLNTEAAQRKFSNTANALANAIKNSLLAPAGKGARQISAIGERFVDALPDREDAKQVLSSMRKRRGRKKSSNTKKARRASI